MHVCVWCGTERCRVFFFLVTPPRSICTRYPCAQVYRRHTILHDTHHKSWNATKLPAYSQNIRTGIGAFTFKSVLCSWCRMMMPHSKCRHFTTASRFSLLLPLSLSLLPSTTHTHKHALRHRHPPSPPTTEPSTRQQPVLACEPATHAIML